ncbi:MAG: tryptophan synthase subunit alpha, partial [Bacteroidetes bacterium]|nr:tryptophan synthase subunit alpha [Bacteroidota bacterium]
GEPPALEDLAAVREATDLPLLVGSGTTAENYAELYRLADGFIVGSALKEGGRWEAPVCEKRVEKLMTAAEQLRAAHQAALMKN